MRTGRTIAVNVKSLKREQGERQEGGVMTVDDLLRKYGNMTPEEAFRDLERECDNWKDAYLEIQSADIALGHSEANNKRLRDALASAETTLVHCRDHCFCNKQKGFDYGEKHPKLGMAKQGRWLSVKELVDMELLNIKRILTGSGE
jgi:hypothetical protein